MPRSHYRTFGPSIEERPLELYLGACEVTAISVPRRRLIRPSNLPGQFRAERVLGATGLVRTIT
jgi:hypothetical protein